MGAFKYLKPLLKPSKFWSSQQYQYSLHCHPLSEGFFVVNKGLDKFDVPVMDLTLPNLEGCYKEIRNNFTVVIERKDKNKQFITRWGTWDRGGMGVQGRDTLYFIHFFENGDVRIVDAVVMRSYLMHE